MNNKKKTWNRPLYTFRAKKLHRDRFSDEGLKKPTKVRRTSIELLPVIDKSNSFLKCLYILWKEEKLCDVTVLIEDISFKAHKVVLAAYSGYIRDMLSVRKSENLRKIHLSGIQCRIIKDIMESMYSGTLPLSTNTVDDVLSAAAFLRVPSVVDVCSRFLSDHLSAYNCLRSLQVANLYDLTSLLEDAYSMTCSNFSFVIKQKEFLKLRYCELLGIVPRQDLKAKSEFEVFEAIVSWINVDKSTRANYATRLLRNIRFSLIPEETLKTKVDSCPYVTQVPEIAEYVREAVMYHLLPYRRPIMQNIRTKPRSTFQINTLMALGGLASERDGGNTNEVFFCNLENGKWKHLTTLPEPRHHHAAAVLEGYIYVAGGDTGNGCASPSEMVWRYDTWEDEWITIACMNIAREAFQMTTLDMKLYVVGGRSSDDVTEDSVETYHPVSNKWVFVAPISSCRRHVALTTLNNFLYAVGGSNDNLVSRRVERYNATKNVWKRCQPTKQSHFSSSLHAIKNRLWLVGGSVVQSNGQQAKIQETAEIEVYSPKTDQWTTLKWFSRRNEEFLKCPNKGRDTCDNNASYNCAGRGVYNIDVPRSEAGTCHSNGVIYLVAGYSSLKRTRIDDVECIKTELFLRQGMDESTIISSKQKETSHFPRALIHRFPRRCTGVACVAVTLFRKPGSAPCERKARSLRGYQETSRPLCKRNLESNLYCKAN